MIKTLISIFLVSASCYAVDLSTVGEMNFNIRFKTSALQIITVDKVVQISSRTAFDSIVISSGYVVAVGTTPAIYWVRVNNFRIPLDDTRYKDIKDNIVGLLTTQAANIQYYCIEAHKCRWGSDQRCVEVQTWQK